MDLTNDAVTPAAADPSPVVEYSARRTESILRKRQSSSSQMDLTNDAVTPAAADPGPVVEYPAVGLNPYKEAAILQDEALHFCLMGIRLSDPKTKRDIPKDIPLVFLLSLT